MAKDEYEKLLKRARDQLPKVVFEKPRFEVPKAQGEREGAKTIISNFSQIASYLDRKPKHLMKFLLRELATSGHIDGPRAVFIGRFTSSQINDKVDKYVNEFVICPECKKPDTKLKKEGRIPFLKCMACGAKGPVRAIK
jgi:translation initiation factor 2 subunit 2